MPAAGASSSRWRFHKTFVYDEESDAWYFVECSAGCATAFTGSAYVEGGADACRSKCQAQGLEFAGMVFMGEYTDGCVCSAPGKQEQALDAATSAAGGTTGVMLQMQRQQNQQAY